MRYDVESVLTHKSGNFLGFTIPRFGRDHCFLLRRRPAHLQRMPVIYTCSSSDAPLGDMTGRIARSLADPAECGVPGVVSDHNTWKISPANPLAGSRRLASGRDGRFRARRWWPWMRTSGAVVGSDDRRGGVARLRSPRQFDGQLCRSMG